MEITEGGDGRSAILKNRVVSVRDAVFSVTWDGQRIEGVLPSGVTLAETARSPGSVTVEVTHAFDIRCIAWILFTDGGAAVGGSLLAGADEKDGAIALHGHEFLKDDGYAVAARLAGTLEKHFGDRYSFTAEGKAVTAVSLIDPDAELAIEVYEYARIEETQE